MLPCMTDRPQSFATHRALPNKGFLAAFSVMIVNILWAGCLLVRDPSVATAMAFALAIALVVSLYLGRRHAQVIQDRMIRLEMKLRLERLLPGQDLKALSLPQVVALRFAGDAELPGLVAKVLARELSTPDQIKRAITDWQPDWLRV